jgi:hypothetical protein
MAFEALWMSARLNYEVLNISMEEIAESMGLSVAMVIAKADIENWKQWFPEDDKSEFELNEDDDLLEGENMFMLQANQYTEKSRKRLQVYQIAKQLMLMGLYTKLEVNLITKANEAVELINPEDTKEIQALSTVLQSLTKDLGQLSQSMTLGTDNESGLPQLIIRDLSGNVS